MQRVELLVVRHDQVGVAADTASRLQSTPLAVEHVDLVEQHAGSTTTPLPMTGVMCGYSTPLGTSWRAKRLAVDHDGVARVVTALVADDHVHLLGQEVGELALALVAPLGADDHGSGHAGQRVKLGCATGAAVGEAAGTWTVPSTSTVGTTGTVVVVVVDGVCSGTTGTAVEAVVVVAVGTDGQGEAHGVDLVVGLVVGLRLEVADDERWSPARPSRR